MNDLLYFHRYYSHNTVYLFVGRLVDCLIHPGLAQPDHFAAVHHLQHLPNGLGATVFVIGVVVGKAAYAAGSCLVVELELDIVLDYLLHDHRDSYLFGDYHRGCFVVVLLAVAAVVAVLLDFVSPNFDNFYDAVGSVGIALV